MLGRWLVGARGDKQARASNPVRIKLLDDNPVKQWAKLAAHDPVNDRRAAERLRAVRGVGATRIDSTRLVTDGDGISAGVDNVAYQNQDGTIVLVAYNNSPQTQPIAIAYRGACLSYRMVPWATDTFIWR